MLRVLLTQMTPNFGHNYMWIAKMEESLNK